MSAHPFPAVLCLAALLVSGAAAAPAPVSRADIVFDHPESFTDIKDHATPTDAGQQAILDEFRTFLLERAGRLVPEGMKLSMTFTDIDLAGDFEPWRGPNLDDVRIVKEIYPPAFKFSYRITDASGRVLKEGSENIRDMSFQTRLTIDSSDRLRYEKDILDEWMRQITMELRKK